MKMKVTISGPKVHDVGYRYFLMNNAIETSLKGFYAFNKLKANEQEVIALAEGDEKVITDFKELVDTHKPEYAEVANIAFENYDGDIMHISGYAQVCTALQMNKAINLLLDVENDLKEMRSDLKSVKENTNIIKRIGSRFKLKL